MTHVFALHLALFPFEDWVGETLPDPNSDVHTAPSTSISSVQLTMVDEPPLLRHLQQPAPRGRGSGDRDARNIALMDDSEGFLF